MARHWKSLVEKDHIGAWSLVDKEGKPKDYTLTIRDVQSVALKTREAPKGKRKAVVYFKETDKGWVLNATNAETLEQMYGPDVDKWVGCKVTLYQTLVRNPKGGAQIPGVRVRSRKPTGPTEALPDVPVDEGMRAQQDEAFGREPGEEG